MTLFNKENSSKSKEISQNRNLEDSSAKTPTAEAPSFQSGAEEKNPETKKPAFTLKGMSLFSKKKKESEDNTKSPENIKENPEKITENTKSPQSSNYFLNTFFIIFASVFFYLFISDYMFSIRESTNIFFIINILFIFLIFFIFLLITASFPFTFLFSSLFLYLIYFMDTWVYNSRLTHIRISDIYLIDQGLGVVSHYYPSINFKILIPLILIIILFLILYIFPKKMPVKLNKKVLRIISVIYLVITSSWFYIGSKNNLISVEVEGFNSFRQNQELKQMGLFGSWYAQYRNRIPEVPDGYTEAKALEVLNRYSDDEAAVPAEKINIIVIMNESFTDYTQLGEIKFDDPLSKIHEMVDAGELFEGKLGVSPYGGGTANTEWEFLTGYSTHFTPDEKTAFLTYVNSKTRSINSELETLGYKSNFFHPYFSQEWKRRSVYDFFDFDTILFADDIGTGLENKDEIEDATETLKNGALVFDKSLMDCRNFATDKVTYELLQDSKLFNLNSPYFTFCVTVQNHGNYLYKEADFKNKEYVKTPETFKDEEEIDNIYGINQFLTLDEMSGDAFVDFIEKYKNKDEKTIIMMFGDHQPSLAMSDYIECDEELKNSVEFTHITPYLVWSNFELNYDFPEYISSNYLSAVLKNCLNLPLTAFDKYLLELLKKYPVITKISVLDKDYQSVVNNEYQYLLEKYYVDASGNKSENYGKFNVKDYSDEPEDIKEYGYVQYWMMQNK